MQCVYFPFQLSGTSYKLKTHLPYQVSLSILGNMHNIGKRVSKKKKKSKKESKQGEARRKGKKMQTPRATLLLKKGICAEPLPPTQLNFHY